MVKKFGDLIGIGGRLGAGKDAVADFLVDRHGWVKLNMSDPLVEAARAANPVILVPDDLSDESDIPENASVWLFADLMDKWGYVEAKRVHGFRTFLQKLGTEVGRNMIDPNVWVDMADTKIHQLRNEGKNVVITGIRFQEELDMIKGERGDSWWVSRPSADEKSASHASETSLGKGDFEVELNNNGTLEELYLKAEEIIFSYRG